MIFLDPPFDFETKGMVLDAACAAPHLSPGGLAIMHLHTAEKVSTERRGLELVDRREYGQSLLLFFRREGGVSGAQPARHQLARDLTLARLGW